MNIGVGASALALGSAVTAHVDDATGTYWNPAALSQISGSSIALMYAPRFDNLEKYSFFSFATTLRKFGRIGASWIRLGIDDIPIYATLEGTHEQRLSNPVLQPSADPEGFLQDIEHAFFISYALATSNTGKPLSQQLRIGNTPLKLSFGVTGKYIRQTLGDSRGTGVGLDVGVHIKAESTVGTVILGGVVQDAFSTKITWNTPSQHEDVLIGNLKAGLGYTPKGAFISDFTFVFDLSSRDGIRARAGAEYRLAKRIALRAGFNDADLTVGAGLALGYTDIDYAFTSTDLENSHQVSLQLKF